MIGDLAKTALNFSALNACIVLKFSHLTGAYDRFLHLDQTIYRAIGIINNIMNGRDKYRLKSVLSSLGTLVAKQ